MLTYKYTHKNAHLHRRARKQDHIILFQVKPIAILPYLFSNNSLQYLTEPMQ